MTLTRPGARADEPVDRAPRPARAPLVPWFVAVPAAVVAGVALDAAFPGAGLWWLAYPALAVGLLLVRGRGLVAAYGVTFLLALGFTVPHLQWSGIYVGPVPWLALATVCAALTALAGPLWALAWRAADARAGRLAWAFPLLAAAGWVAAEALRARWPFGGFGWGRVAFSQADAPVLGVAALGGAPLLSAVVVALAAVLAQLAVVALRRRVRPQVVVAALVTVGLVGVGAAGGGAAAAATAGADDGSVRVAAVQGNVPRLGLDFNAQRRAVLDNHVTGTTTLADRIAAGEEEPVDLVLWPENSSDVDPLRDAEAAAAIDAATDAVDAPVMVGAVLRGPGENITNAALVWEPGTGFRGDPAAPTAPRGGPGTAEPDPAADFYAKQSVVPFAEYIPYRSFFRAFSPFVDQVTDFAPGERAAVLPMGGALVGPAICFEVVEDDVMRAQVLAGADLLVVPTNNATFGLTDENTQQLAMSRVRAVEHGRQVVHISNVGTSAVVDVDGSTGVRTELFTADLLVDEVDLRSGSTPATALGEGPELVLVGVALLLVVGHGILTITRGAGVPRAARPPSSPEAAT